MYGASHIPGPGVFEKFFREAAEEKDTQQFLIIAGRSADNKYGHQFNAESFENLMKVLDNSKILILANGTTVTMPPNARLVFISNHQGPKLTPATVSRMGMVSYN